MLQCYNVTMLQCYNVTMLHCNVTMLQCSNSVTQPYTQLILSPTNSTTYIAQAVLWNLTPQRGGGVHLEGVQHVGVYNVQYMWGVYMVEGVYNMWGVTVGGFYPKFRSWFHFKLKFHTLLLISQMRPWYRPAMGVFVIRPSTKNTASCLLLSEKNKDKLASVGTPKKSMDVAVFPPLKLHHMCCFVSSPTDIRVCTIR